MRTFIRRLGAMSLLVAFSLALVACGNKEAEQRKAFITFLQARVLDRPGLHVPTPSAEEKASFGDYAQHYAVITDFNEGMNKSVSQPMTQIMAKGALRSIADLPARRDDLKAAKDGLTGLRTALDQQAAKADAAHAQLKQPDDLKQVYDKAFDRTVTVPATTFKEVFPALDTVFDSALAIGDFLEKNKSKIQIAGSSITVTDPAVQAELNKMLQQLNGQSAAINAAQRKMQAVVRGG
ncbi:MULTISPECIES: DUF3053 domain-containing protein [unclassified Variovorax]|uniref:DUF3053 domain-containing protein n=1 Tax=unclassified Variovorax TaxID=663243 RepID=UPI000F7E4568|nr:MULTISPECIES: DUF3053 domain-containing protein [unclassified Variovorax]RSZ42662.1 DUF3053 domain-containing protein [Variovorax sp. 553]RSZ43636.1 DUF3053 domain-containing protein [Variovorax sp. 679]